jgi:pyruvate decarboxylase
VYIFLPLDVVAEEVDATRLETPLDLTPPTDAALEKELVHKILEATYEAKNPIIIADILTARFHCTPEVRELVKVTNFPVFPTARIVS